MSGNNFAADHQSSYIDALIPVIELKHLKNYLNKFDYRESSEYLQLCGLDIADFYFKREPDAWFCYYRDFVLIDIPVFTRSALKTFRIVELINLQKQRIKECLDRNDFKTLFYIIDKRLAVQAFFSLYDTIPDDEKYDIFWFMYSCCNLKISDFAETFIKDIISYRNTPINIEPQGDGYITVYRGHGYKPTPVTEEHSWTLDINTAIRYTTGIGLEGTLYKAKVHSNDILAYIKRKNEKEIVVFPSSLKEVQLVNMLSLSILWPRLKENGIIEKYHHYVKLLKPEYFCRPWGVHGVFHTRRVLFLTLCLADRLEFDEDSINLICIAAVYHDIGRINDNLDPQHGILSYKKAVKAGLIRCEKPEEQETVRFLIENHCISDQEAYNRLPYYNINNHKKTLDLYEVFKDADGLDRIRINDLNIKHLRTEAATDFLLVARQLIINLERWVK